MIKQKPINYFIKIIKEYKFLFLFSTFCAISWGSFLSFQTFILKRILDILQKIPKESIFLNLKSILFYYFFFLFLMLIILRFQEYFSNSIFMPKIRKKIIDFFFSESISHNYSFFQKNSPGEIADKIKNVSGSIVELLKLIFDDMLYYFFTSISSTIILFKVFPICGLITTVWIIFFMFIVKIFINEILRTSEKNSKVTANAFGNIIDVFLNILSVKLFYKYDFEKERLKKSTTNLLDSEKIMEFEYTKIWSFYTISFAFVQSFSIYFLIKGFIDGKITIGDLALVWGLNVGLVGSIWKFARDFAEIQRNWGKINDAFKTILNEECFVNFEENKNKKKLSFSKGEIEFDKISFSYPDGKKVFENFSLSIKSGEKIGIVGYSGSGKTTLINLLLGLFDLKSGSIKIDSQDINTISEESLKEKITLVPQTPFLFNRTIAENVNYGNNYEIEDIINALKNAEAYDFVKKLNDNIESNVGEGGSKLSGGQRQRIILARAFLKNSEILILDEATSSLDSKTEKLIQKSLNKLMQDKTVIVIAHRLSTLIDMDRIIVLKDGKISQDGTHLDLIKEEGLYKELWNSQGSILLDEYD